MPILEVIIQNILGWKHFKTSFTWTFKATIFMAQLLIKEVLVILVNPFLVTIKVLQ